MYAKSFTHAFFVLILVSTTADAQQNSNDYGLPDQYFQPVTTWPPDFGHTCHHDSTAYGNWLSGWARARHADGTYLVNREQAAVLAEQARAMRTYNHRQWIAFRVWNRERWKAELQARTDAKRQWNLVRRAERESKLLTLTN